MPDYFEIDRLIEDLAKVYSTACATAWFKLSKKKNPSKEEYRSKVVEYMKQFEHTLDTYPNNPDADAFRAYAKKTLDYQISAVLAGQNKEVEKRYRYYVEYN